MYFTDEGTYIASQTTAQARIVAIDACIDALLTTALKAAGSADMQEYMLNDGQTVIKKAYRNPETVYKAVEDLERIKTIYINQINPRVTRLVDSKNLYINRVLP